MGSNWIFDRRQVGLFVFLTFLLVGCTKEGSLGAVYTGENDWVPTFVVTYNNYQRIGVSARTVSSVALLRNIDRVSLECRSVAADSFTTLTSTSSVNPNPLFSFDLLTDPVLDMGSEYSIKMAVYYRDGTIRYSTDTSITATTVRGKILKSIRNTVGFGYVYGFWWGDGAIIFQGSDGRWRKMDTTNAVVSNFPLLDSLLGRVNQLPFTFNHDTLYLNLYPSLIRINLETGRADTTNLDVSGYSLLANGEKIATFNWSTETIVEFDAATGAVIDSCKIPINYVSGFCYSGNNLYLAYQSSDGFNWISELDVSTGQITSRNHNPVYSISGLAWDGMNFWVWDNTDSSFDKVQLEGY